MDLPKNESPDKSKASHPPKEITSSAISKWAAVSAAGAFAVLVAAGQLISGVKTIIDGTRGAYDSVFSKTAGTNSLGPKPTAKLSIVVLPFKNLSNDAGQDYFVDGVTEGITNDLSQVPGAFVIARNTAFSYRTKVLTAGQLSAELGVRYVLEGSIQRAENRVRITAALSDATSGAQIWSDRFDKDSSELLKMQDEITTRLSSSIGVKLVDAESTRSLNDKNLVNPKAVDLSLRGLAAVNRPQSKESLSEARDWFEQAIQIEPNAADALAWLARTYVRQFNDYYTQDAELLLKSEALAIRAVSAAPTNWLTHLSLAAVRFVQKKPDGAFEEMNICLNLNPNAAECYGYRGFYRHELGRAEEGPADIFKAMELDPRSPFLWRYQFFLGDTYLYIGKFDAAIEWLGKSVAANPGYPAGQLYLAAALSLAGRDDEAKAALGQVKKIVPNMTLARFRNQAHSTNVTYLAQRQRIGEALQKTGLPE